jgi:drug/metabolite transporter (DMT)-like permease
VLGGQVQSNGTTVTAARWVVWWLALSIAFRASAAIFAKLAALLSIGKSLIGLVWNPWFVAELAALALQALAWTLVLRHRPVSRVYPYNSLVFIINLMAARWLFGETITLYHIVGMTVIAGGVVIMATARMETGAAHA